MRGRGGADIEDLVGDRLRSILAAAGPPPGWVPGRLTGPPIPVDQDRSDEPARPDDLDESAESEERLPEQRGLGARVRWQAARPGAVAMCLVAVLAAVLSAGLTWWFRPEPLPAGAAGMQPSTGTGPLVGPSASADGPGPAATADSGAAAGDDQLVISVIGQVHQPGLVTVEDGSRVADAISAAGGALAEADLSTVNLARLVVDGEQIAVGIAGSSLPGGDSSPAAGLVNLNTASQAELEALPGIGPVLAQRIIDYRDDNGGFTTVEQLREVSGIGPTLYDGIVDLVTV